MTDAIQVITTLGSKDSARSLARALVEARVAGCVQVAGPISSIYHWEGKIEEAEEWMCVIKTRRELFYDLEAAIRAAHPYQVPEIMAVPVVAGGHDYLSWLAGELVAPGQGRLPGM